MDPNYLEAKLGEYGHLHLFLDSGAEVGVMSHDTTIEDGRLEIHSKHGDWSISCEKVEYAEKEHTHFVSEAE